MLLFCSRIFFVPEQSRLFFVDSNYFEPSKGVPVEYWVLAITPPPFSASLFFADGPSHPYVFPPLEILIPHVTALFSYENNAVFSISTASLPPVKVYRLKIGLWLS